MTDSTTHRDEQALFDSALRDPDQLLLDSLRSDERRRRRRRLILFTLLVGGFIMATTCLAVLAGWLTLAATTGGTIAPEEALQTKVPGRIVDVRPITKDCMVLAYIPQWNHGDVDNVGIANNDGGVRALFAWDPVPAELVAPDNRRAFLAVYSRETTAAPTGGEIEACALAEDWSENTSWQNQPKIDESAEPSVVAFAPGDGWKLFDVTSLVRRQKPTDGHGTILKFKDETRSGNPGSWSGYALVSREGEGQWQRRRPYLVIVESPAEQAKAQK